MMKSKESVASIPNTCLEVKACSNRFLQAQLERDQKDYMENDGSAMSKLILLQESQRQQRKNEILGEPEPAVRLGTSLQKSGHDSEAGRSGIFDGTLWQTGTNCRPNRR